MPKTIRVVRLFPDGNPVSGMGPWQKISHDAVINGEGQDRRYRFYVGDRHAAGQIRVGIWEATAYTEKLENYPKDEFMQVIEGSVTIVDADGREETFVKGDSFFMPSGFCGLWKQTETMKKYFMVFDAFNSGD